MYIFDFYWNNVSSARGGVRVVFVFFLLFGGGEGGEKFSAYAFDKNDARMQVNAPIKWNNSVSANHLENFTRSKSRIWCGDVVREK